MLTAWVSPHGAFECGILRPVIAILVPSGDQDTLNTGSVMPVERTSLLSKIVFSFAPSGSVVTIATWVLPSILAKAIRPPSGDHEGVPAAAPILVSPVPSAPTVYSTSFSGYTFFVTGLLLLSDSVLANCQAKMSTSWRM